MNQSLEKPSSSSPHQKESTPLSIREWRFSIRMIAHVNQNHRQGHDRVDFRPSVLSSNTERGADNVTLTVVWADIVIFFSYVTDTTGTSVLLAHREYRLFWASSVKTLTVYTVHTSVLQGVLTVENFRQFQAPELTFRGERKMSRKLVYFNTRNFVAWRLVRDRQAFCSDDDRTSPL